MDRKYITSTELAKLLDIDIRTLRKQRNQGNIPAIKVGRDYRYDPNQVAQALSLSNQPKQQGK
jgi:excisionase family DNA binding protein